MELRVQKSMAGAALILLSALLFLSFSGLTIEYKPPFAAYSPGELNIWVAYFTLWLPGAWMVSQALMPRVFAVWHRLTQKDVVQNPILGSALATLVLAAIYRVGRRIILCDQPVTDEEFTNQFGGRVLASGHWFAKLDIPHAQMPTLFLLERSEGWTSFDFIGIQAAWAFSELTHTDSWIFAICAGLTVVGMFWAARELFGERKWGLIAALVLAFSPMAWTLSLTTHAHVLSRMFLVWFVWAYARAERTSSVGTWSVAGLLWGAGMITRPAEMLTLTLGLILAFVFGTVRRSPMAFVGFSAGVLPSVGLAVLHNINVSGVFWQTPRMAENTFPNGAMEADTWAFLETPSILARRLADNVLNNIRFGVLYWFGGVGGLFAVNGLSRSRFPLMMVAGMCFHAAVGVLHDNDGVRIVGPIHYSEWVVFLTLLAVFGIRGLVASKYRELVAPLLVSGVITSVLVAGVVSMSIHRSNAWHSKFLEGIDTQIPRNSVVLAPRNAYFWRTLPAGTYNGSWVFETRSPKPDLSDERLILRYTTGAETWAQQRFPDRNIYIVKPSSLPPYVEVIEVQRR